MQNVFEFIEKLISGMFPFTLLMVVGLYFTVKTRGYQFKNLSKSVKVFFMADSDKKDGITPFESACNSLSATVGTGNIVGVASAVAIGGAGAVFWMWVSALVAMCVKAVEIVTAINFKEKKNGEIYGGPMYYIKNGMPESYSYLAKVYAFSGIFACFCSGNIIQTNSAVICFGENINTRIIIGVIFALITAVVVIGGVAKISKFTTKAVPIMSVLYILLCLGVVFTNIKLVPKCLLNIFIGAFNPSAVTGGAVGSVLTSVISGASKGVFSNEAGLGTAAMAYSSSSNDNMQKQALYGIFEVFLDTIVLCTLTALTILCSGIIIDYGDPEAMPVIDAFSALYGGFSQDLLAFMLCLFGISSIIGWAVYGISCSRFLFGNKGKKIFTCIYPLFCIFGAVLNVKTVWRVAEFFNGIMLIINLFSIFVLADKIIPVLKGSKNDTY